MSVLVRVPASTSNLGAGFDCVGIAVSRWLQVTAYVEPEAARDVTIERSGTLRVLSLSAEQDLLCTGFAAACRAAGRAVPRGLVLEADSDIPIERGLGSSAAAIVAGATAARELLALDLDERSLIPLATELEGHPDNAAAAIYGGAVLVVSPPTEVRPLQVHPSLALVFAVPDFGMATAVARAALPPTLPHAVASSGAARAAALVAGLASGDRALLAAGLDDVLHVPYRRALVSGYDAVTGAATAAGAFGATLSGSGSSIVAVAPRDRAAAVGGAMVRAWRGVGVAAESFTVLERVGGCATKSLPIRRQPISRAEA